MGEVRKCQGPGKVLCRDHVPTGSVPHGQDMSCRESKNLRDCKAYQKSSSPLFLTLSVVKGQPFCIISNQLQMDTFVKCHKNKLLAKGNIAYKVQIHQPHPGIYSNVKLLYKFLKAPSQCLYLLQTTKNSLNITAQTLATQKCGSTTNIISITGIHQKCRISGPHPRPIEWEPAFA